MLVRVHLHAVRGDDDALHLGLVREAQPVGVLPLEIAEDLLAEHGAVGAALAVREHRAVPVVVGLEQLPDARLRHDGVELREIRRDLVQERRFLGDDAGLGPEATAEAQPVVAQVDHHMVQREHAHMAGEPLDADGRARLGDKQVEQLVGVVERALTLDCQVVAELRGDVVEGALEVGGELSGVAAARAVRDAIALEDQDAPVGRPQRRRTPWRCPRCPHR